MKTTYLRDGRFLIKDCFYYYYYYYYNLAVISNCKSIHSEKLAFAEFFGINFSAALEDMTDDVDKLELSLFSLFVAHTLPLSSNHLLPPILDSS